MVEGRRAPGSLVFFRGLDVFFASLLDFSGCRKRCDIPQGATMQFSFSPIKKPRGMWCVCVSSPNCLRDDCGATTQPALCVPYVSAMCTPWRTRVRNFPPYHGCVAFIRLSVSGAQPLSTFVRLANKVDDTRGDAEQLGQPRRASLFLVDHWALARPQRGASTLLRAMSVDLFLAHPITAGRGQTGNRPDKGQAGDSPGRGKAGDRPDRGQTGESLSKGRGGWS